MRWDSTRPCMALLSIHAQLLPTERLCAFLDDVYITSNPERTVPALHIAQEARANVVQVHLGKTRAWNAAWEEPPGSLRLCPQLRTNPLAGLAAGHCRRPSKASSSLAAPLAAASSWLPCWQSGVPSTTSSWPVSLTCRTCSPRGCYCCCARPRVSRTRSPPNTTQPLPMELPALAQRRATLPLRMGGLDLAWRRSIGMRLTGHPGRTLPWRRGNITRAHWPS